MVELTESEASSLRDYIEFSLITYIREDTDVDSMLWLDNMVTIWRKCGGRAGYAEGKEDNEDRPD